MNSKIVDFYKDPNFRQPVYRSVAGEVTTELLAVPNAGVYVGGELPEEIKPTLASNIERLYDSIQPYKAVVDGNEYTFEIGHIGGGDRSELRVATYQSSLTGNLGNGFEIASIAAENPEATYVYVASLGMGLSSSITTKEQEYLKKYGRLLYEEDGVVKPLPVVQALGKVVFGMGFDVTRLGSDSAGALLTVAYGATYGRGIIESVHQNVRTGINDMGLIALGKGMMYDDGKLSQQHALISPDALRMNTEKIDFTKANMSQDYREKDYHPKKSPAMMWTYARGLGKGPKQGDPLVADNIAFARSNPNTDILFTIGDQDPLAKSDNLDGRVRQMVESISRHSDATVSAAIIEGGNHGIQTHYPQFLRRLARTALA